MAGDGAWTIRELRTGDRPLLLTATLENLNWCERRFTEHDVLTRPEFRHYAQIVLDRGDLGLVAEDASGPVGAAWALFASPGDMGFGFVDDQTPEVSLWVRADRRRLGIGRALVRRLQGTASSRGITRLSLSVEPGNYARQLYLEEGFIPVASREGDGVMVWPY